MYLNTILSQVALTLVMFVADTSLAAAEDKTFQIYFGQQSSTLTPQAQSVATAIIKYANEHSATSIDLIGHADTADNRPETLSLERAEAVEAFLKSHNLPASVKDLAVSVKVAARGVGASDLAIKTGPNVAEPLNRIVTATVR